MKVLKILLSVAIISLMSANSFASAPPHWDLDMTSEEYEAAIQSQNLMQIQKKSNALEEIVLLGKRNLEWLNFMNEVRSEGNKLSFSSAETQIGYPIEEATEINEQIIISKHQKVLSEMPQELKKILIEKSDFTRNPPLPEKEYLEWGRSLDRSYQRALRWQMQQPYLSYYETQKRKDISGYYFLQKEKDLKKKLDAFKELSSPDQQKFRSWLKGQCMNLFFTETDCNAEFLNNLSANTLWKFYEKYVGGARRMFESYFRIPQYRRDITWTAANSLLASIPFAYPGSSVLQSFLKDNIEEEWQWKNWKLQLNFVPENSADDLVHLEFEPGATPHVNALGGSIITMDANVPLTEYNVMWTIRHEFGHVLGFPDCYLEFYDRARGVMVSYQIDVSNLMCSRKGHLQDKHFDEMKRVYYK